MPDAATLFSARLGSNGMIRRIRQFPAQQGGSIGITQTGDHAAAPDTLAKHTEQVHLFAVYPDFG
jgi:hypothetical protein